MTHRIKLILGWTTIKGTYVNIQAYHLFRYLDQQSYRFNCRNLTDHVRFQGVTRGIAGHTLTYDRLTGQGASHDGQTRTERV